MSELRLLSVVMPVYNARPYLDASIASILEQTYADFEFVIGDDGSTDGSRAVLRAWADRDPRIRLLESNARRGPAASSNWVVGRSQGRLVARMDADDVSHRDRLRRQLDVLARHPEIDLVGSLWDTIDADGRRVRRSDRWRLARRSAFAPFAHPSVMFRREAFENAGGYRHRCEFWEDTDLYLRMAARGRIAVLADVLLRVRSTPSGVRLGPDRERIEDAYDEMFRCLAEWHRRHDYDSFLRDEGRPRRLVPGAFIMLGAAELWAGGRPSVLPRLGRRGRVRADPATLLAAVWGAWAAVSPATLRGALRALHLARAAAARRRIAGGALYEWVPDEPPRAIG